MKKIKKLNVSKGVKHFIEIVSQLVNIYKDFYNLTINSL